MSKIALIVAVVGLGLILQLAVVPTVAGLPQQLPRPELSGVVLFPPQVPQAVPGGPPPAPPGPALREDVNVSNSNSPQNETAAAVDPTNASHVVAGANDYRPVDGVNDAQCGFYNSTNGARSWTAWMLPRLNVGATTDAYDAAGDPSVAVDGNGVARVGCLHFERSGTIENAVVVHKVTFKADYTIDSVTSEKVIESLDGSVFHDKPYVAVGPGGAVYVSWTEFNDYARIRFAYKPSGAANFTVVASPVSDTPWNQGSVPVVSGGYVYVAWLRYPTVAGDPHEIRIDKAQISPATGALTGSFGTDTVVVAINPIPSPFTGQSFRNNSFPTLAQGGTLYLAWAQRGAGADEADIVFTRSINGGATWSTPIRVNDDATTRDQFFPWMAVDGSGKIHIIWYDKRDDSKDKKFHTYYARSENQGVSFLANQRVSDRASNPSGTDQFGGRFVGDYNGIGAGGSNAYPVFMAYRPSGPNGKFADQEVYSDVVP